MTGERSSMSSSSNLPAAPRSEAVQVITAPTGQAMVSIEGTIMQEHSPPWWLMPIRVGTAVAAALLVPASGVLLATVVATLWIVSGFVVRYPVTLPPGHALFKGGLSNTARPGRYWLRRRWSETAHSISLEPLRLDWRPAPTRIEHEGADAWLELKATIWVRPREDEVGQFRALLLYRGWQEHQNLAARRLREELLGGVLEWLVGSQLVERGSHGTVELGDDARGALVEGLQELGLEAVAWGPGTSRLVPRTEDLTSDDWLRIDRLPVP